jgi:hypothetical protein
MLIGNGAFAKDPRVGSGRHGLRDAMSAKNKRRPNRREHGQQSPPR